MRCHFLPSDKGTEEERKGDKGMGNICVSNLCVVASTSSHEIRNRFEIRLPY